MDPAFPHIKLAIIGCGRWGINHVKTAHKILGNGLKVVCDADEGKRAQIAAISPAIRYTTRQEEVLADPDINAVIVATPAATHFEVALRVLKSGKHALVEKPLTLFSHEAQTLVEEADRQDRKLMVGHVLLFHPAVRRLKEMCVEGRLGKLQYIYSNRLNLGMIRSEENILWSFAPHDISVVRWLTEAQPLTVDAWGGDFLQPGIEDVTVTYMTFPRNIHAHIFVSWLNPFKEQRLVVVGDKGMAVFEDSRPDEKLKFYPKGFEKVGAGLQKFEGANEVIAVAALEPLAEEQRHFFNCIEQNTTPLADGRHGVEILKILEQAQARLQEHVKHA